MYTTGSNSNALKPANDTEKNALKKLDEAKEAAPNGLDLCLFNHPRFLENYFRICNFDDDCDAAHSQTNYLVKISPDGKSVIVRFSDSSARGSADKEEYLGVRTISLTKLYDEENCLKVEKGYAKYQSCESHVDRSRTTKGGIYSVMKQARYFNSFGLEMSRSEFSDHHIPLDRDLRASASIIISEHLNSISTSPNKMPTITNGQYNNFYNGERHLIIRVPDNFGLARFSHHTGLEGKEPIRFAERKTLHQVDVNDSPENLVIYPHYPVETTVVDENTTMCNGIPYDEFYKQSAASYQASLTAHIDHLTNKSGFLLPEKGHFDRGKFYSDLSAAIINYGSPKKD